MSPRAEKKHIGIVLKKHFSRYHTYVIFDRHDGKITGIVRDQELLNGALISYFAVRHGGSYKLSNVQVLDVPFDVARHDISFLHHVLELCYYFLPFHSPSPQTFNFVTVLYDGYRSVETFVHKKLFVFKLLVSFGVYNDHQPLSFASFHRLSSESIDSIAKAPLHLEFERKIDNWMLSCVRAHPYFEYFNTVGFLTKIRAS